MSLSARCLCPKRQSRDATSSTFSMRWKSMWIQSRDCRNVDASQAVRHVRSIVVFSTGVEVSDTWFAVEGIRRALRMPIKLSTWSEQALQHAQCVENSNFRKIADTLSVRRELGTIFVLNTVKRLTNRQKNRR